MVITPLPSEVEPFDKVTNLLAAASAFTNVIMLDPVLVPELRVTVMVMVLMVMGIMIMDLKKRPCWIG